MNEEYLLNDVPWDDENIVDREPEQGDGRHHFGFLRLYPLKVTKVFEGGHFLTIPNVQGGNFENIEHDENGLMKFKGWKPGGDRFLFVFVATKQNKDGDDYQIVKQYPSKVKKNEPHLWGDFVMPDLNKLSKAQKSKMTSEGAYCEWDELPTGHKVEIDGEEHDIKAWGNFKPHSSQASLQKASAEFFAQFSGNNVSSDTSYPATWVDSNSVEKMLVHARTFKFEDHNDLATQLGLFEAKTTSGENVNVARIISEVLNILEPMVKL